MAAPDAKTTEAKTGSTTAVTVTSLKCSQINLQGDIPGRSAHTALLADGKRSLVVIGGQGASSICSTLYRVGISDDFTAAVATPCLSSERLDLRLGHASVLLPHNCIYTFGGFNGRRYVDHGTLLDIANDRLLVEDNKGRIMPPSRRDHTLTRVGRQIFMLFGWNADAFPETWILERTRKTWVWKQATTTGECPSARRGHSASKVGKSIFVFGGLFGFTNYKSDIFELDTEKLVWKKMAVTGAVPPARAWHSATELGSSILIVGGTAGRTKFFNDAYLLDTQAAKWTQIELQPSPAFSPRCAHSATLVGSRVVLFGGLSPTGAEAKLEPSHELWSLDTGVEWKAEEEEPDLPPEPESSTAAASSSTSGGTPPGSPEPGRPSTSKQFPAAASPGDAEVAEDAAVDSERAAATAEMGGINDKALQGWLACQFAPEEPWAKRYFRLSKTDLYCYEEREKGLLSLNEGLVKQWTNKRNPQAGLGLPDFLSGQIDNEKITEFLTTALSGPNMPHQKEFLAFCSSAHCDENPSFYLAAGDYIAAGHADGSSEQLALAKQIWEKYIAQGAPSEIFLISHTKNDIKQAINDNKTTKQIFDQARKHVFAMIKVDILPKFLEHLKQKQTLAEEQLVLKSGLTEEDKKVESCENCLLKFTFTTRRNYCRYCGNIYCNPCVSKQATLPPQYGLHTRVRVCDMCAAVLSNRPNHFAFSFVSRKRNRPLNLATDTEESMREWMAILVEASKLQGPEPKDKLPLHREGWLNKEDPTSKVFRRRYFVLHHTQLAYYEMSIKKTIPLRECVLDTSTMANTHEPTLKFGVKPTTAAAYLNSLLTSAPFPPNVQYAHRFRLTATLPPPPPGTSLPPGVDPTKPIIAQYQFAAKSNDERTAWKTAVQAGIEVAKAKGGKSGASAASSESKATPVRKTMASPSVFIPPLKTDRSQSEISLATTKPVVIETKSPRTPASPHTPRTNKPEPEADEPTFMFAQLCKSKRLSAAQSEVMTKIGAEMLTCAQRFGAVEVKRRAGTASLVQPTADYLMEGVALTCNSVNAAMQWATGVQARLNEIKWAADATQPATPGAKEGDAEAEDTGPRLCIGIHYSVQAYQAPDDGRSDAGESKLETKGAGDRKSQFGDVETKIVRANSTAALLTEGKDQEMILMAVRLAGIALPGQILCTRDVWRAWRARIEKREVRRTRMESITSAGLPDINKPAGDEDRDRDEEDDLSGSDAGESREESDADQLLEDAEDDIRDTDEKDAGVSGVGGGSKRSSLQQVGKKDNIILTELDPVSFDGRRDPVVLYELAVSSQM